MFAGPSPSPRLSRLITPSLLSTPIPGIGRITSPSMPTPSIGVNATNTPYTEEFFFSFQRQFTNNQLHSVSYLGSQSHHQLSIIPFNSGNPTLCQTLNAQNPGSCGPNNESAFAPVLRSATNRWGTAMHWFWRRQPPGNPGQLQLQWPGSRPPLHGPRGQLPRQLYL